VTKIGRIRLVFDLMYVFQTNLSMGNCSWLTIGTRVQSWGSWWGQED